VRDGWPSELARDLDATTTESSRTGHATCAAPCGRIEPSS